MPLADRDFIDGDLLEFVEFGFAEAALQRPGLDVLDRIPADAKVLSHVLDGHELRQFQDVALESARIAFPRIGEGDLHLAYPATSEAEHAGHLELHKGRFAADGHHPEGAFDAPLVPDLGRPTLGAAVPFTGLLDAEGHLTSLERLADVAVTDQAERVIQ